MPQTKHQCGEQALLMFPFLIYTVYIWFLIKVAYEWFDDILVLTITRFVKKK